MNSVQHIRAEIENIGYSAIEEDYVFADVFAPSRRDRMVQLAAFTHKPPSYRNAAFAVIKRTQDAAVEIRDDYRALGAPLLFVIRGQEVTVWQMHSEGRPTVYRETSLDQVGALFIANRDAWNPKRIHSAKSFGSLSKSHQLDFVDVGLLPAIEGEIHTKLDRLLTEALADIVRLRIVRPGERVDDQFVFRTVFRLLAAKVLQDKGHELARLWDPAEIDSVLDAISRHYTLPGLPGEIGSLKATVFDSAWARLRDGINFRNISADDLAFVYENTLVTEETRRHFGTHSTPRAVAEYVVTHLGLWQQEDIENTTIYEPFAGAGAFMVAALRHLRDLLPVEMTELERHRFLIKRITGDEIDPFAAEVATLSLILADYPNENGWNVSQIDLFDKYYLIQRAKSANVVLCNPPFEPFTDEEQRRYPEVARRSLYKSVAALEGVLDAKPMAIGFVLPEPFITGRRFERQRRRIEGFYRDIELVALPDRVFEASVIRSSLLIARGLRERIDEPVTYLRSTVVNPADREKFLKTGEVSDARVRVRPLGRPLGKLWVEELNEIWEYIADLPVLGSIADVHKGIEWQGGQANAVSGVQKDGFYPGVYRANSVLAYALTETKYLDFRPGSFARRTGAFKRPWRESKVLANAARFSGRPWCFAAAVDHEGLLASQQLFGVWAKKGCSLYALCALLNSPLAVAYIATHSPPDRIRQTTVTEVPIPHEIPRGLDVLAQKYAGLIELLSDEFVEPAKKLLLEIDAQILRAYDLPPRLERRLLEYFRGETRPTVHEWEHWFPEGFQPFIPLYKFISEEYQKATQPWIQKVFKPLPPDEAARLREYMD
jgi:hypothetical protein